MGVSVPTAFQSEYDVYDACLHHLPGGFCSTFILVVHPKSRQKVRKVIVKESS